MTYQDPSNFPGLQVAPSRKPPSLPVEICSRIFEEFAPLPEDERPSWDLLSLCATSSTTRSLAMPILYRHIYVASTLRWLVRLARTLESSPAVAKLVRGVTVGRIDLIPNCYPNLWSCHIRPREPDRLDCDARCDASHDCFKLDDLLFRCLRATISLQTLIISKGCVYRTCWGILRNPDLVFPSLVRFDCRDSFDMSVGFSIFPNFINRHPSIRSLHLQDFSEPTFTKIAPLPHLCTIGGPSRFLASIAPHTRSRIHTVTISWNDLPSAEDQMDQQIRHSMTLLGQNVRVLHVEGFQNNVVWNPYQLDSESYQRWVMDQRRRGIILAAIPTYMPHLVCLRLDLSSDESLMECDTLYVDDLEKEIDGLLEKLCCLREFELCAKDNSTARIAWYCAFDDHERFDHWSKLCPTLNTCRSPNGLAWSREDKHRVRGR